MGEGKCGMEDYIDFIRKFVKIGKNENTENLHSECKNVLTLK